MATIEQEMRASRKAADEITRPKQTLTPWKALNKVNYTAVPDRDYTREKTGAGDIDVMYRDTPKEGYTYGTGYAYPHPKPGNNVIIYNPDRNDEQDIRLDALHIMRKDDPVYGALVDELSYYADGGDVAVNARKRMEDDIAKYGHPIPGLTEKDYFNNELDGLIRNMLIEGSPDYIKSRRYYPDKQQLREWNKEIVPYIDRIQRYLESGETPDGVIAPSTVTAKK